MMMTMCFVNHLNQKGKYTTEKVNGKGKYLLKLSWEKIKMVRKVRNATWKQVITGYTA